MGVCLKMQGHNTAKEDETVEKKNFREGLEQLKIFSKFDWDMNAISLQTENERIRGEISAAFVVNFPIVFRADYSRDGSTVQNIIG